MGVGSGCWIRSANWRASSSTSRPCSIRITRSQWASTSGSWLTSSRVGPGLKASPCSSTWAETMGSSADKGLSSSRMSASA
ncbi:hypothetical protein D3C85_680720 [compost metagenome]